MVVYLRVAIVTSKATSLTNVGRDIAYVLEHYGHAPRLMRFPPAGDTMIKLADAVIMIYPCSPLYITPYFLKYRDYKKYSNMKCLFYTTIEGEVTQHFIQDWMRHELEFIAVSKYVRDKLRNAGFKVIDVIPHGVVKEDVENARKMVGTVRKTLEEKFPNRILFGVIAFWHIRKGLYLLVKAVKKLSSKRKDFIVYLITNTITRKYLEGGENLFIDTVFGKRSRAEILAWMGALDYLIIPSLAEGFCLPLLEANVMGTPVIHADYPPLNEISDSSRNLVFPYENVVYEDTGEGIDFELHYYNPDDLMSMMHKAIDLKKEEPEKYEEMCSLNRKIFPRFSALKVYKRFLKYLEG